MKRSHPLFRAAVRAAAAATDDHRVARSLRDVARGHTVHTLLLANSPDLICRNMMCEHLGGSCACRLALVLERVPALVEMDLSNNQLRSLPDSTFALAQLKELNVSQNQLTTLSPLIKNLRQLELLDLRANRLETLPEDALAALPYLQQIRIADNPNLQVGHIQSPELRAKIVQ